MKLYLVDFINLLTMNTEQVKLMINGKDSELKLADGYAVISRRWKSGDKVEIDFPMPVRKVIADERVTEDKDKIAFQRGPVIFCAEWPEITNGDVLDLVIKKDASVTSEFEPSLLDGTQVIKTTGFISGKSTDGKTDYYPGRTGKVNTICLLE